MAVATKDLRYLAIPLHQMHRYEGSKSMYVCDTCHRHAFNRKGADAHIKKAAYDEVRRQLGEK